MKTTDEYEKQANALLNLAGVSFSTLFSHTGKYFPDDTQTRDIYNVTLKNAKIEYAFQFGQSLTNSGVPSFTGCKTLHDREQAILQAKKNKKAPTAYGVLSSLTKNEPGTHKEFCEDMGIDEDSRKGLETYLAVQKEYFMVRKIFGSFMEQLQEIS